MKHVKITAFDIPDAWFRVVSKIWYEGELFNVNYGSEEGETKKLNITIEIKHPNRRPLVDFKSPNDIKYVNWYTLSCLWSSEKDDSEYTYGNRMQKFLSCSMDQIAEAIERLKQNAGDRQCTVVIRIPTDIKKGVCKNPPCLTVLDFEILDGKLHTTGYFRSWDAYAGLPANLAGLQLLAEYMAKEIGVSTGKMVFHSKNCHIYKRQYGLVEELLNPKMEKLKWKKE
jgi:thymidylate synthase